MVVYEKPISAKEQSPPILARVKSGSCLDLGSVHTVNNFNEVKAEIGGICIAN